ncbi:hypothetical protein DBIPINDM_000721 [Mesorhizobium sp. AR02]|uniref:hypothetical protein n=1 Tax=Mesorhizobium sp. AR02 TaxID=2865837 RepID=UPI00215FAF91|nr:hypothetical protein [Mesorhizobium sp. AR02]UVK54335.1 hypothetical protein DBIPINDM_000721 [Mesorhizobium sp. AR02]
MPISKSTAEIAFSIPMLGWKFGRRADRTGVVVIFRSERARFFHAAKEIVRPVGSLVNPDMVSETFPAEVGPAVPLGPVMPERSTGTRMPRGTLVDVKVTGTIHALQGKSRERRTPPGALRRRI